MEEIAVSSVDFDCLRRGQCPEERTRMESKG